MDRKFDRRGILLGAIGVALAGCQAVPPTLHATQERSTPHATARPTNTLVSNLPEAGTVVTNHGSTLIGNDGSSVIAHDGGNLTGENSSAVIAHDGGNLISNDSSTFTNPNAGGGATAVGASSIAHDGVGVIAHDGATLINRSTNAGGSFSSNTQTTDRLSPIGGTGSGDNSILTGAVDNTGGKITGSIRVPTSSTGGGSTTAGFTDGILPSGVKVYDTLAGDQPAAVDVPPSGKYSLSDLKTAGPNVVVTAEAGDDLLLTITQVPGHTSVTANIDAATTAVTLLDLYELSKFPDAGLNMAQFQTDVTRLHAAMSQADAQLAVTGSLQAVASMALARLMQAGHAPGSLQKFVPINGPASGTRLVGDDTGSRNYPAFVDDPTGLALAQDGRLLIADSGHHLVRAFSPGGGLVDLAGSPGAGSDFSDPRGIATDGNTVYVADRGSNRIVEVAPGGSIAVFAGTGTAGSNDGAPDAAQFDQPTDLVFDAANHQLLVADAGNATVRAVDLSTRATTTLVTSTDTSVDSTQPAGSVAATGGTSSTQTGSIGSFGSMSGAPGSTSLASARMLAHLLSTSDSGLQRPGGIAINPIDHNVYVSDSARHCIWSLQDGVLGLLCGAMDTAGNADGLETDSRFNTPAGLACDGRGNLYVADTGNNTVRIIETQNFGTTTLSDKNGPLIFKAPTHVLFQAPNTLYVTASGGNQVWKVTVP